MELNDTQPVLLDRLRRFRRRLIGIGVGASFGWAMAGALACLIAGVWLDLVFELSPALRIAVLIAAGSAGVVLALAMIVAVFRAGRFDLLARRLDAVGSTGGQIRSGTDLLRDASARSSLSVGLADIAIERAASLADRIAQRDAVPRRPLLVAVAVVLAVLAVMLVAVIRVRPMTVTEYRRFADPFGDHPPYSRVSFAVEPGDAKVLYGASQEIKVTATGLPLDRLDLVLLTDGGGGAASAATNEEVLPMFGEPGGVWRATVAGVTAPVQYFVRAREGRSHRFHLGVITTPRIESVRVRVTPPAYTHRGASEGPVPQAGLAGLPGTKVQVFAKSNRPLSGGRLEMTPAKTPSAVAETIAMLPTASGEPEASGTFEIRQAGRITVRVRDIDGQESQDAATISVSLRPDERPFVRLLEPPAVALATPTVPLPVTLSAEDDYGISRLGLYRSLNDSRALPADLALSPPEPSRQNYVGALPLPAYQLRPGDEIKLFARVEDNDPVGAKGSESPIATIRIISQEDYERLVVARQGLEVLQSKYQQAQRRMEEIAAQIAEIQKELAKAPPGSPTSEANRKKIADLAEKMREHSREMSKAAESMLPFDLDPKLTVHLQELADKLEAAADETAKLAEGEPTPSSSETREDLDEIAKSLKEDEGEYEKKTVEPLEYLAKLFPLKQDEARFVALYRRQKELADRLESLQGKEAGDDPLLKARMRDLEGEQYQIREDLKQLLDDIEDHVRQLPEEPAELQQLRESATAFVNGVRDSGAADAMADAEAGLAAFSGTRGAENAREAEQILKMFLGQSQGMGQNAGKCLKFSPQLNENLGNTVDQLLAGAGLSTGDTGMGASGSGYSAESSTLDNVGLFGQLPALGGGQMAGERREGGVAVGRAGQEGNFEGGEPGQVDPLETLRATGAGQNAVPPEYRERVGAYLERIADELGERNEKSTRRRGEGETR
jgi:hypothetical protein